MRLCTLPCSTQATRRANMEEVLLYVCLCISDLMIRNRHMVSLSLLSQIEIDRQTHADY